jgi:hypothetical protein
MARTKGRPDQDAGRAARTSVARGQTMAETVVREGHHEGTGDFGLFRRAQDDGGLMYG